MESSPRADQGFYGLGIAPNILNIIDKLGFKTPTPIQEKAIPMGIEGTVMGLAQTGTGKTLAFGIPLIQAALAGKHGLIITPARELALQVQETINKVGGPLGIRTALLVGGESNYRQVQAIHRLPQIIIGTPGRIMDHMAQRTLNLNKTNMLVLDEADRMLDMGFAPQLKRIMVGVPRERQTMLFSATMPQSILSLAQSYMKLPLRMRCAPRARRSRKSRRNYILSKNRTSRACLRSYCTIIVDRCSCSRAPSTAQRRSPPPSGRSATPPPRSTPTARSASAAKRSTDSRTASIACSLRPTSPRAAST